MRFLVQGALLLISLTSLTSLTLPLSFVACTTAKVQEGEPNQLYADAEDEIKSDHYQVAIDKLRAIKNKYPYSKVSVEAQLRIADVYFLQDSFAEAAAAYESFRDLHPKHEKVEYASFRAAQSYYKDIPGNIARDMTPAIKALDAYNDFLRKYPASQYTQEAKDDLSILRENLAAKELYVGDFYYKRDFYESARPRYKKILELYPETNSAAKAKEKLDKIGEKIGDGPTPAPTPSATPTTGGPGSAAPAAQH